MYGRYSPSRFGDSLCGQLRYQVAQKTNRDQSDSPARGSARDAASPDLDRIGVRSRSVVRCKDGMACASLLRGFARALKPALDQRAPPAAEQIYGHDEASDEVQ